MDAWAKGKPLLIWPMPDSSPSMKFLVAGYARLPKGDVFFTDTWTDPTFAGHSVHLLDGHAEPFYPGAWRVGRAIIETVDEEPFASQAAAIYRANEEAGADQARFDQMAADTFGNGSRYLED